MFPIIRVLGRNEKGIDVKLPHSFVMNVAICEGVFKFSGGFLFSSQEIQDTSRKKVKRLPEAADGSCDSRRRKYRYGKKL